MIENPGFRNWSLDYRTAGAMSKRRIPSEITQYLGVVELFEIRKYGANWFLTDEPQSIINPGSLGLICSWADEDDTPNGTLREPLQSGHVIELY